MDRFQWRCPGVPKLGLVGLCGRKFWRLGDCVFDHIGQRSITGDDSIENYQPLCPTCNDIKTHGVGGERRVTTAGSDAGNRKKLRRLGAKWRNHREAMRGKGKSVMAGQRQWIELGKRLERMLRGRRISYGVAAAEVGIAKASFYRACLGRVPSANNYIKIQVWLKDSQRRIGRKRVVAAARRATRRSKDDNDQLQAAGHHRPGRPRETARDT